MSIASEPKHCPKCQTPLPGDAPQGLCPKCLLAAAALPTEAGQPAPDKTPPSVAELAAAFPQLEVLELIGQGGMGFVFKARQPKLDRFVALKILPQSLAADPAFAERFSREGRVLARLNHPNIVTIHDFGVTSSGTGILPVSSETCIQPVASKTQPAKKQHTGGTPVPLLDAPPQTPDASTQTQFYYLLMEFVDGVNLRQAMRAGRFTPDQALAIVPKICEALQFAHNEGILHRDIKPENILLDAKGRVKIADFGIAKLVAAVCDRRDSAEDDLRRSQTAATENLTEAGKALGTPNYMAPEQRECSGEVDQRADIYSLGVVFYEMLTGELPLGRFAPPSQKSTADPRVDKVVLRALEKEKAKRYASADEVKTQVETIAATPDSGRRRGDESQTEKQSADKDKSQSLLTSSPTGVEPRFSPTAIVGAAWVTLFFLVAIGPLRWNYGGQVWLKTLMFLPCLLGLSAILGTTILGWIAVSQIRRSAGKLHGLWLAVFDGLFFPLLALDGLIFVAVGLGLWAAGLGWKRTSPPTVPLSYLLFVAVLLGILLLLDFLIIRRVWRAVNKGGEIIPSAPAEPARKNSTGKTIAIGCGVVAAVGLIILLLMVVAIYLSHAPSPSSARLKEQQKVSADFTFGPVMERVLNGPPFVARLNQAEVELVAVGNQPWTNPVCWLPNGQPSAKPFPTGNGSTEQWAENMDVKKIAFYIRNESAEGVSCPVCRVSKESGAQPASSGWDAPDKRRPNGYFGQIIVCPSNTATMNISLGVANGAWETVTTLRSGLGGSGSANGEWSATYQAVAGGSEVAVGYTYSKNADWESRMAYVDGDDKVIPIQENSSHAGDTQQTGATLLVSSNEFAHIKEFQLQRRKYQWAEFRNVSLQPGHATTVTVQDFGGANASPPVAQKLSFDAFVERVRRELSRASIRFDKLHISAVNDDNFIVSFSGLEAHGVLNSKDAWLPITGSVGSLVAQRVFFGDKWDFKGLNQLAVVRFTVADLDLEKLLETNLAEAMPAAPAAAPNLSFGPVVERTLRISGKECDFLSFRSGEVLHHSYVDGDSNDETPSTAFMKWVRENGVDVGFCVSTDKFYSPFGLLALDMGTFMFSSETIPNTDIPRFRSVAEWQAYNAAHRDSPAAHPLIGSLVGVTNVWNDLTADQLLEPTNDVPAIFLNEKKPGLWFNPTNLTGPIAFSTRDGIKGILQITSFTENPRGVKFRYKLVQSEKK